jgi:hypothetical protein
MKKLLAISLIIIAVPALSANQTPEFLSWYNGWGMHTVWGVGKLPGNYTGTTIKCGDALIRVRAVYDTHQDKVPPKAAQSSKYLEAVNLTLLDDLANKGNKCIFQDMKN